QPGRGELGKARACAGADPHSPADHSGESKDQEDPADEAPLFRHGGEDEVRVTLGQILEVALAAVKEAFAPDSTGADRDLGLGDVIAGALWIALRVEKDVDAFAL